MAGRPLGSDPLSNHRLEHDQPLAARQTGPASFGVAAMLKSRLPAEDDNPADIGVRHACRGALWCKRA